MRRALAVLLVLAAVATASGCSGQDAQEAQGLLTQSNTAFSQVRSVTFSAKLWTSGAPQDFTLRMAGGAYMKGKRAGDAYAVVSSDGTPFRDMVVVQRSGRVTASINGTVVSGAFPPTSQSRSAGFGAFTPYIKDVKVEHGKLIDGEPMTKVTGVVDTKELVESRLSLVAQLGESGIDLGDMLGDTRAILYISDVSHLPTRTLADVPMKIAGEKITLHLDFAYTSFNAKLRFPGLR